MLSVELSGGPSDGSFVTWTDEELDALGGLSGIPESILARDGPKILGHYLKTRSLSRSSGKLLFRWCPITAEVHLPAPTKIPPG